MTKVTILHIFLIKSSAASHNSNPMCEAWVRTKVVFGKLCVCLHNVLQSHRSRSQKLWHTKHGNMAYSRRFRLWEEFPCEVKKAWVGFLELLGPKGQTVIRVNPEPGPLSHPLERAFLSVEDASDLLQLLLVPLQITDALSLQQVELLQPVIVHGDVFAQVRVEAEISVGREEGVEHGVNLWRQEESWTNMTFYMQGRPKS